MFRLPFDNQCAGSTIFIRDIKPTMPSFYQPAGRVKTLVRGTFLGRLSTLLLSAILTIVQLGELRSPGNIPWVLRGFDTMGYVITTSVAQYYIMCITIKSDPYYGGS